MNEEKSPGFKIRLDEETEESASQPEVEDSRIETLRRKITMIMIVVPFLMIVILGIAYIDIKRRVDNMQDTGTTKVQDLSEGLESKFSSLSLQYAKQEESLGKRIQAIETEIMSLKETLNQAEKSMKAMNAAKADKKDLTGIMAKIDEALPPLHKDLESAASEIKNLGIAFKNELTPLAGTINGNIETLNNLKKDVTALSLGTIDQKKLELALQNERKNHQKQMNQLTGDFGKKILSLENKIAELKKIIELNETPPPPPGKIIEQDIQPKTP